MVLVGGKDYAKHIQVLLPGNGQFKQCRIGGNVNPMPLRRIVRYGSKGIDGVWVLSVIPRGMTAPRE